MVPPVKSYDDYRKRNLLRRLKNPQLFRLRPLPQAADVRLDVAHAPPGEPAAFDPHGEPLLRELAALEGAEAHPQEPRRLRVWNQPVNQLLGHNRVLSRLGRPPLAG